VDVQQCSQMRRRTTIILLTAAAGIIMRLHPFALAQQEKPQSQRKVVRKVVPMYPDLAKRMNVRGLVRVEALVAPNGTVKSTKVIGGHPLLAQAAVDAVNKWKFGTAPQDSSELIELKFDPD